MPGVCKFQKVEHTLTSKNRAGVGKLYAINKQIQYFIQIYILLSEHFMMRFDVLTFLIILFLFENLLFRSYNRLSYAGLLSWQVKGIPELIYINPIQGGGAKTPAGIIFV